MLGIAVASLDYTQAAPPQCRNAHEASVHLPGGQEPTEHFENAPNPKCHRAYYVSISALQISSPASGPV
jgi:hypothetical protein